MAAAGIILLRRRSARKREESETRVRSLAESIARLEEQHGTTEEGIPELGASPYTVEADDGPQSIPMLDSSEKAEADAGTQTILTLDTSKTAEADGELRTRPTLKNRETAVSFRSLGSAVNMSRIWRGLGPSPEKDSEKDSP